MRQGDAAILFGAAGLAKRVIIAQSDEGRYIQPLIICFDKRRKIFGLMPLRDFELFISLAHTTITIPPLRNFTFFLAKLYEHCHGVPLR